MAGIFFIGQALGGLYAQMNQERVRKWQYQPDQIYAFKLQDQSFTPGYVLARTETAFQVTTFEGDTLNIWFSDIRNIISISMNDIKNGEYWPVNSFNHKYWTLPSAFTPADGQLRMSSHLLFANALALGIGLNA